MSELPFPFGYYRTEGGDYLRVVVRSQTDQPLDQVTGLSLLSNEGFHALFYMKVAAPSPAFSLNPIIPNSWMFTNVSNHYDYNYYVTVTTLNVYKRSIILQGTHNYFR